VYRHGFEGHLVFDLSVGYSSPRSSTRDDPSKTEKGRFVESERGYLHCHRCEFRLPVGGKRSCCREPIWVGQRSLTVVEAFPDNKTGGILCASSRCLTIPPVYIHLASKFCGPGIRHCLCAVQCPYVEISSSWRTPAIVPPLQMSIPRRIGSLFWRVPLFLIIHKRLAPPPPPPPAVESFLMTPTVEHLFANSGFAEVHISGSCKVCGGV
jgi:hypothetical protein